MITLKERMEDMERDEIISALTECNGIMARAARKLGITARMIGYKVNKYRIKKELKYIEDDSMSNQ